jgi:hypothetical protein
VDGKDGVGKIDGGNGWREEGGGNGGPPRKLGVPRREGEEEELKGNEGGM